MISIVIRTFNEQKHLDDLLSAIAAQAPLTHPDTQTCLPVEVVLVDSGSNDATLSIATRHRARITHIAKAEFTFGRSLNIGCEFAKGDYLVFISGHCIPASKYWLQQLISPLLRRECDATYGRQIGKGKTKFSETQLFEKYFPAESKIPQDGYFCNNANAAVRRDTWAAHRFDETLTGLEDLRLGQQLRQSGGLIGYVAEAAVYHLHDESWRQVRIRYEREAVAMQRILPELHFSALDLLRCVAGGVLVDLNVALQQGCAGKEWRSIFLFRWNQFYGVYRGNHHHRKLSHRAKMRYYYPSTGSGEAIYEEKKTHRVGSAQGK